MRRREFAFVAGKTRKFWNVELSEHSVHVHFGRIGASGRRQTKEFPTAHQADAACQRLIAEKLGKGYKEVPTKPKEPPAESLTRTKYRVGQCWSFKTDVANIHPVLQILGVEEHPSKGIFCVLDIRFRQAVTQRRGSAVDTVPAIELSLTAEALDRSLDELVDAKAPLPDHILSAGEFTAPADSWRHGDWTYIADSTLDEAILRHLGVEFPPKIAKKMGWPVRPRDAAYEASLLDSWEDDEPPLDEPPDTEQDRADVAMVKAILRSNLKKLRALIAANPAAIHLPLRIHTDDAERNPAGMTAAPPLLFAAAFGNRKVVELLLKLGARVDAVSDEGWTPLFLAARTALVGMPQGKDVAELLEKHGAALDLNSAIRLVRLDWVKQYLRTHKNAVQDALSPGSLIEDTLAMLYTRLVEEPDDDYPDIETEASAAIYADAREIIERLLDMGADPYGMSGTALYQAIQFPNPAIAKLLLERGADPNRALAEGQPFYLPDIAASTEMRQLLISHGAREDPHHTRRNYHAKGYVSIWLGRFASKKKFEQYTTDPEMSGKVVEEYFKEDFGVDVFDGVMYEDHFSAKPVAVKQLLNRFSSCNSFGPAAIERAMAAGWKSANCASLIYEFRYEVASSKVRRNCPMTFVGAFPYWDEDRLDSLMDRGKFAQALVEINRALEIYPNGDTYLFDRGWILENLGRFAEAKADYERAIDLGNKQCLNNLAWVLATTPADEVRDASRAVDLALRACEVTYRKDASCLGTLAAAYANNEQFEEAIATVEKALAREKSKKGKADLRAQLKRYQAGQPFRDLPHSR